MTSSGDEPQGLRGWFTRCTVRRADRGERFEFDVDFGPSDISRWTYEFTPSTVAVR